ncbi:cytochrome P450 [Kitasatospora sp. NBC_00458]|uniref:cytochrome P450 n=1 Tax=Kitasatospora sp. NBC_00458 TaxID=2903568 RepID=UPI002E1756E3
MSVSGELRGKVALVTGGARNVGKVIAKRLAADGALVVINHLHSPGPARETQAEIERAGGQAYVLRASVAVRGQVDRMFDEIGERFGGLDILVNNAANGALVPSGEVTEQLLDRALGTNLKGGLACAQRAAALMAGRGGGSIVNVSTLGGGQFVMANYLACGPAKAAVEAMTRYLAVDHARDGVRVNTAAAGMLYSDVVDLFPDAERMQRATVEATPMGRLGHPEELAEVVAFLASPRSSWITGQLILADGGLSTGQALLSPPRAEVVPVPPTVPVSAIVPAPAVAVTGPAPAVPVKAVPVAAVPVLTEALAAAAPVTAAVAAAVASPADLVVPVVTAPPAPAAAPVSVPASVLAAVTPAGPARTPASAAAPVSLPAEGGASFDDCDDDEIAIVGMGIVVPGANDLEEYWHELLHGADRFVEIPADRWDNDKFHSADKRDEDKTYSKRSAFITDFVPHPRLAGELAAAGIDPDSVESTTLWLRHSLMQAMEGVARGADDRCSFLVGYTADGSQHLEEATVRAGVLGRIGPILDGLGLPAADRAAALDAIGRRLTGQYPRSGPEPLEFFPHRVGLNAMRGLLPEQAELLLVDTACSSSLYAVDLGLKGLLEGRHDIAVCSGSFAVGPRGSILFAKLNGLSVSGEVRSLDTASDGVLFSDGAATVVLKRLGKARRDGDRVLATIRSFGSSSDGKGKAIYAPSAAGQKLAIRRALDRPGMADVRPDWIVAHATGTPAGDLAEFTTLRETLGTGGPGAAPVVVTSNKSVIGHTGWAAGVASLIEVVLGFQYDLIPPQHRFTETPADFAIGSSNLVVPTEAVPWPRGGRRRTAAVSGFGFGGTNAHLVVQEPPATGRTAPPPAAGAQDPAPVQRIAIVARTAHVPGTDQADDIESWLGGTPSAEGLSFGDTYPLPSFQQVRMPPGMMRGIDRCQLMILKCAHRLRDGLGSFWEDNSETTGVVLGHLGATRNATLYATRCYLDDLTLALRTDPSLASAPWLPQALDLLRSEVRRLVPPSNEDSFPGMMPNVIPARVANYFDLKGLNMTVDTGFTSTLSAIDVAIRYLRQGELSMALVGGINGNSTDEVRQLLDDALDPGTVLAEGAFLLALVTEETAVAAGLDVLGYLDTPVADPGRPQERVPTVECGARSAGRPVCYLGAEGAVGVLQVLAREPAERDALVVCRGEDGAPDLAVRVSAPGPAAPPAAEESAQVPSEFYDERHYQDEHPLLVTRQVPGLTESPGRPVRDEVPFWPAEPTVVLTDRPETVTAAGAPGGTLVLSTVPGGPGIRHVADAESVRALLDEADPDHRIRHIRLITDLSAADAVGPAESEALTALHELLFLVVQQRHGALADPAGASCVGLLLGAMTDRTPHPATGLFTGLFKVIHLEYPHCLTYALVTGVREAGTGAAQAARESGLERGLPVAYHDGGRRFTVTLSAEPGELVPPGEAVLGPDGVVVAVGGGRGITAELLTEVARHFRPTLYVLGSNPVDSHPREYLELDDEAFAKGRADYIRRQLALRTGRNPAQLNREYERIGQARVIRANLDRMAAHSGAAAVHYLTCDVGDPEQVMAAMDRVHAESGRIDLLINAAGLNRSAPIATKSLAEFRQVRDLKVRGYANLKAALRGRAPLAWCNFGSLLGMTGQVGEADYASGNDFLGTSATYHHQVLGAQEFTIGWTLWGEVGLGANELTKAYFEKSGLYSAMSTAEGVHHFVRELNLAKTSPYTVHLGDAERRAVEGLLPGFLDPAPQHPAPQRPAPQRPAAAAQPAGGPGAVSAGAPAAVPPGVPAVLPGAAPAGASFYLGEVLERAADSVTFERVFDLETDDYLRHHRVGDVPTLPGTFVTEIAFEAASWLVPGLQVYAFEDLRFHHFLKVREQDRAGLRKRIRAEVVDRRPDLDQAVVAVRITGDVVAPNGTVLVKDRLHFEVRVLMSGSLPAAPDWKPWYPAAETPVPDPYHSPGSPVMLTDLFVSTADTRLHPEGKRATYDLRLPSDHRVFAGFGMPVVLLDGLARTGVLALVDGDLVPLAAPLGIGRIDVYEHGGDCRVAERYGRIDLYAVLPDADADGRAPGTGNRFVAVRPDGRVLLQMKDLAWTLMGYLDRGTGRFLTPEQAAAASTAGTAGAERNERTEQTESAEQTEQTEQTESSGVVAPMGKAEAGAAGAPTPVTTVPQSTATEPRSTVTTPQSLPDPRPAAAAPERRPPRRPSAPAEPGTARPAPGPRGLRTVPGSLRRFQRNAPGFFRDLGRSYGDTVRLPLGFFTVHLNYHPDNVRYVLQDNNQNYVRGKGYDRFKIFMGMGLLTLDGEEWKQHRRVVNPLFHKTAIDGMATTMTDSTTTVLDRWERAASAENGVDVVPEMMELTLGALGKVMFDTDLHPVSDRVGPAMVTSIEAMVFRGTLNQLTPDVVPIPYNLRIRKARRLMYDVVDEIVESHRAGRHEGLTDLVSLLLQARDESGGEWTRQQIRDEIMTVFMAGHETTGTGLAWALYELAKDPEAQERLHEEVERVLGGRTPGIGDLDRLPYTRMVADETLRLHPPIWVYPRDAVQEDEVGGWRVPAGGSVFMVPYVTHRHPDFWVDPERFDPERFSEENRARQPRYAYFPFGGGQRKCIGNQMAVVQMHLTLAMVAQRFRLRVVPDHPLTLGTLVSFRPLDGIRLVVEPRKR